MFLIMNNKVIALSKSPYLVLSWILRRFLSSLIKDDALYLKLYYYVHQNQWLNLQEPQLFTEKIQWLKLYNRDVLYQTIVDKIKVKDYVSSIIGEKYIIPTLFIYDDVNEIDFSELPDRFVLKTNNGGGNNGVVVCKDKLMFDEKKAIKKLKSSLDYDIYLKTREWPYYGIDKKVFAEVFMEDHKYKELIDYKFYCFNGRAEYCQVITNRNSDETIDFYDRNWVHQPFYGLNPYAKNALELMEKPSKYEEMLFIADKLSTIAPFLRVDLYFINSEIYFGEMTFFPNSGVGRFTPSEWDYKLGCLISLSNKNN